MKVIDVNHKYGHWTVIEQSRNGTWRCRCHCGTEQSIPETWLLSGFSKSYGCKKSKAKDLRNQRFGRLIAIGPVAEKNPTGASAGDVYVIVAMKLLSAAIIFYRVIQHHAGVRP